jgi:hypothetical protein
MVSPRKVNRSKLRLILMVGMLVSAAFAAWAWVRPYSWKPDPAARCTVVGSQVKQDIQHHWVNIHLKMNSGEKHDLLKPVRLLAANGREHEPADTTLGSITGQETSELWFKFWLAEEDLNGPLKLRINDGELVIRSGTGLPKLGTAQSRYFTTHHW